MPLLETVEKETGPKPAWTILWLHGLGAELARELGCTAQDLSGFLE